MYKRYSFCQIFVSYINAIIYIAVINFKGIELKRLLCIFKNLKNYWVKINTEYASNMIAYTIVIFEIMLLFNDPRKSLYSKQHVRVYNSN